MKSKTRETVFPRGTGADLSKFIRQNGKPPRPRPLLVKEAVNALNGQIKADKATLAEHCLLS
ncbi:hypothetical protein PO124_22720 [Bacillus licheniformis]|nr:hypothetical protein [Bacillus licheniformis]